MAATIEVNKKSVERFLCDSKDHNFLIPEYQRPYEWGDEQIQTLFDDLFDFINNESNSGSYFLGCIVTFENSKGEWEIIDGQQRITSLFLLLRAIYCKLNSMSESKQRTFLMSKVEKTIWYTDQYTGDPDFTKPLIRSEVICEKDSQVFYKILETGESSKCKDHYSSNYRLFTTLIDTAATDNPIKFYDFIVGILDRAVLFPINADSQDTALSIFTTLNNRGLQLSDADIFKSKIYQNTANDKKSDFIENWKKLDDDTKNCGISIQTLFNNLMSYYRACAGDKDTSTPKLRRYFSDNKDEKLRNPDLITHLQRTLELWTVINNRVTIEGKEWLSTINLVKSFEILKLYPNELWIQPIISYYLSNYDNPDISAYFEKFIHKLLAELITTYLVDPRLQTTRFPVLNLNIESTKSLQPEFNEFKVTTDEYLADKLICPPWRSVRMFLTLLAYEHQDDLLPNRWEIEHILPSNWKSTYITNLTDDEINDYIEHLGNKVPFEKRLNIQASDGYLSEKKKYYAKSKIEIAKELANHTSSDWRIDSIENRDTKVSQEIVKVLNRWKSEYNRASNEKPSEEDLKKIEEFRKNGWIQ